MVVLQPWEAAPPPPQSLPAVSSWVSAPWNHCQQRQVIGSWPWDEEERKSKENVTLLMGWERADCRWLKKSEAFNSFFLNLSLYQNIRKGYLWHGLKGNQNENKTGSRDEYRHTSDILQVRFQTTALKRVVIFLLVEGLVSPLWKTHLEVQQSEMQRNVEAPHLEHFRTGFLQSL